MMYNSIDDTINEAYIKSMRGIINESTETNVDEFESALTTEVRRECDSILEAYNASNRAEADKNKKELFEACDKMKEQEVCKDCGEASCVCDPEDEKLEEGMPSKVQILNALKDHSAEEVAKKFNLRLADVKAIEKDGMVNEASNFEKFVLATKTEKFGADAEISENDMLALYAECELMWESYEMDEAEITSDEQFEEYAMVLLKKAHGDNFDQGEADKLVKGILSDTDGDYGAAVGIIQASLD